MAPAIDRIALYDKLTSIADKYLVDSLNEEDVALFITDAKQALDLAFDDYILAVNAYFTGDSPFAIRDAAQRLRFTDISEGYRRQIRAWVAENPIAVERRTISLDALPDTPFFQRESVKRSLITLGIGSVVVVGLRIITGTAWLWLAELVVLALTAKAYRDGRIADDENRRRLYAERFRSSRTALVDSIRADLNAWLDSAEARNAEILKSFDLSL